MAVTSTKKITDLTENTGVSDADLFMIGSAGTATLRKLKWSTIVNAIRVKLGIGTASQLQTASKEVVGAINELNTKIQCGVFSGTTTTSATCFVAFPKQFPKVPAVCITVNGTGGQRKAELANVTNGGVTIIISDAKGALYSTAVTFSWIAICG